MRIPRKPPLAQEFMDLIQRDPNRAMLVLQAADSPTLEGRYPHYHKLRFHTPPGDLTHEEWWHAVKFRRRPLFHDLPLKDKFGMDFVYLISEPMPEVLHQIDLG